MTWWRALTPRRSASPVTYSRVICGPRLWLRRHWKSAWSASTKSRSRPPMRRSAGSKKAEWAAKAEVSASRTISKPNSSKPASPKQPTETSMNNDSVHGLSNGLTNYGDKDFALYLRKSFARSMGYSNDMLARPTVGIAYTPSGFNNCHRHFPELLDAVKRGVIAAGGLPMEFPTVSLGEVFLNPTSLRFRNLMAMDTEEMIRAQPMDSVVLMGGCDKTVPAQLMGAVSAGLPAIQLVGGPMMTGRHQRERLGACTDCRRFWGKYRAGQIDQAEIDQVEGRLSTTSGTCAVMGTASTMACIAEALGMMLPGTAAIPAVHADRLRAAEASGIAAVHLIGSGRSPDKIITAKSVENALRVLLAIGGSTNAIFPLPALSAPAGIPFPPCPPHRLSYPPPLPLHLQAAAV